LFREEPFRSCCQFVAIECFQFGEELPVALHRLSTAHCQRARRHASVSSWKFCCLPSITTGKWWNT
jgi:hypothetical protein